ncbi:NAD(P)H-dependent oxidoreductase [Thalassomonas viridans]|uniref:FMN dependent NADH:quinone oxidoreductase n=1 Tax=Thalassomonas viridans TaxID=137584 RepID=A0AAF0CAC2_9GAMM|nr:NAD(P)H-dependent oxidoreductase [Thalassomonas viridans]WDE06150.1 NAD(P)H-dependent oxidoreductase [Thalassomonas viridans]
MNKQSKKVLIIKSSPAAEHSVSNEIADFLVTLLEDKDQQYDISIRDLAKEPAPVYDSEILNAFYTPPEQLSARQKAISAPSLTYIEELKAADIVVFASPMHNFSITTLLKAYIDQICRMGLTFRYHADGPEGLVKGKQALIIGSAGGDFRQESQQHKDFQTPYLKHVLHFIGIEDISVIPVQGLGMGEEVAALAKQTAKDQLKQLAASEL